MKRLQGDYRMNSMLTLIEVWLLMSKLLTSVGYGFGSPYYTNTYTNTQNFFDDTVVNLDLKELDEGIVNELLSQLKEHLIPTITEELQRVDIPPINETVDTGKAGTLAFSVNVI
jgi:hypothetical protein